MKIQLIIVLLFVILFVPLPAQKTGVLEGTLKPTMIDIYDNALFVVDMDLIRVYDLKNLELVKTFGKKGEGPGEYQIHLEIPLRIRAAKDYVLIESISKLLYYSHKGKFLKEIRKPPFANIIQPIGKKFIGRRLVQPRNGSMMTSNAQIYDDQFKLIKELYVHKFIRQGPQNNMIMDLGGDFLLFDVADNKIFIEESGKGPIIEVFDFSGEKLREIKIPYKKIAITSGIKDQLVEDFKNDPTIRRIMSNNNMSWNTMRKTVNFKFPDYFPSVQTMDIDKGKIYIKTYEQQNNATKYIIMDLKGEVLKSVFVTNTVKPEIMSAMMGIRKEKIYNDKIYYIIENDDEEWEFYVQKIK